MIIWQKLTAVESIDELIELSAQKPIMIFKHSTTCSISQTALARLERNWSEKDVPQIATFFVDLLSYRSVSNKISESLALKHESPQVIIIKNGKVIHDASHMSITFSAIRDSVRA